MTSRLAKDHIVITAIAPGPFKSDMNARARPDRGAAPPLLRGQVYAFGAADGELAPAQRGVDDESHAADLDGRGLDVDLAGRVEPEHFVDELGNDLADLRGLEQALPALSGGSPSSEWTRRW
jgi:NAD(P)-dependent dehydrogenase (short-subunit alcohol dehydrogenase family)